VEVVVRVTEEEAARLLGRPGAAAGPPGAADAVARRAGVELAPQHPGVDDRELARWFVAALPDRAAAERLVSELLSAPGVEAAFFKPGAEPAAPM
jgi:hypothetical protein